VSDERDTSDTSDTSEAPDIRDVHVVVRTARFDDDLAALLAEHGFRVDAIFPADAPSTAIVSAHGVRLRLEQSTIPAPVTLHLLSDALTGSRTLPGGTTLAYRPFTTTYELPDHRPSLVVSHDDGERSVGRAGMRYRDLLPDRWGGRFVASHISIPDGGPVPDYVHFHKVRFQMIFVQSGWVRLVYEDQGEPFVMVAGDCVLQPPEIRHRVLEASVGLEVVEVGCPALHETIADWKLQLPNGIGAGDRMWDGQRFVRHVAAGSAYRAWHVTGWEYRDTGIADATRGLAAARVARPAPGAAAAHTVPAAAEFLLLVCLAGSVAFHVHGHDTVRMLDGSSVAVPAGTTFTLRDPSGGCELLEVALPGTPVARGDVPADSTATAPAR
jgi:mannose-6-phosphate isomerase-like protein (cupin superfamily)